MKISTITTVGVVFVLFGGAVGLQQYISSQITSKVQQEMPNASGVSASVPLADMPSNLTSDFIKSANINIKSFALRESGTETSLAISASSISKVKPTLVGSLEVTATIPALTILKSSKFSGAQIVGNALQVSVGAGGMGKALLVPQYSNNQLYFELQSVSIFGDQIPASALSADLQNQIKSMSQRKLTPPEGLKVKSVLFSEQGLSVKMIGSNVQLGSLGSSL